MLLAIVKNLYQKIQHLFLQDLRATSYGVAKQVGSLQLARIHLQQGDSLVAV